MKLIQVSFLPTAFATPSHGPPPPSIVTYTHENPTKDQLPQSIISYKTQICMSGCTPGRQTQFWLSYYENGVEKTVKGYEPTVTAANGVQTIKLETDQGVKNFSYIEEKKRGMGDAEYVVFFGTGFEAAVLKYAGQTPL